MKKARNWQGLLDYSSQWIQAEPGNPAARFNLGVAYGELGRYGEAIEAYWEALRLEPDDAWAWYNFAQAYAKSGNSSAALEAVKRLRRYDTQKADELFNLNHEAVR